MGKKCGHLWKVIQVDDIMANCSVVDCLMECKLCKKGVSATIHIDYGGEE